MFYKGSVFATTQEEDMLIVTNAYLQKPSRKTEKTACSSTGEAARL